MRVKTKSILSGGRVFLRRISFYLKKGSVKIHWIQNDDMDEHHSHPWDFKSLILFGGYYESTLQEDGTHLDHLRRHSLDRLSRSSTGGARGGRSHQNYNLATIISRNTIHLLTTKKAQLCSM